MVRVGVWGVLLCIDCRSYRAGTECRVVRLVD